MDREKSKTIKNDIRLLAVDVDNTLLDFDACAFDCIRKSFDQWKLPFNQKVFPTFMEINEAFWRKIERNEMSFEEHHKIRWNTIFAALGITDVDGEEFEVTFREHLYDSHICIKGALEAVEILSKKYPMMIVSNGAGQQQKQRIEKAGLRPYFFDVLTSMEVGCKKPDPKFFDVLFDHAKAKVKDIQREQILVIGDSLITDVQGAISSQMNALWFHPEAKIKMDEEEELAEVILYGGNDWNDVVDFLMS
ncbi:HAD-IA family hydrolase [Ileibacterium valens]|uniref:Noncanonical pyrimidine nucleotidase, YjjG family n=1 Tax=Ileibacterium valens TaxID=1862668 RepID=A0A1U7NER4_9FIRM|nr:HAD-IA family hydrolase [Ileibacterium valens]OLU38144.1 hypothetical protein BO222_08930 [Ileibacterium valens]OLU42136.1 hypothetical protein BM735_02980 [Erysipelotrichaceae bacterium NYU-BL-F16]OLU42389.1 hypothetical protein BO224_01970 [Erysipelotrichaceae bacterium NYU-BL-E8]